MSWHSSREVRDGGSYNTKHIEHRMTSAQDSADVTSAVSTVFDGQHAPPESDIASSSRKAVQGHEVSARASAAGNIYDCQKTDDDYRRKSDSASYRSSEFERVHRTRSSIDENLLQTRENYRDKIQTVFDSAIDGSQTSRAIQTASTPTQAPVAPAAAAPAVSGGLATLDEILDSLSSGEKRVAGRARLTLSAGEWYGSVTAGQWYGSVTSGQWYGSVTAGVGYSFITGRYMYGRAQSQDQ